MSVEGWIGLGTIVSAIIVAGVGYRQAMRVADRNASPEDRRVDVEEWQGILSELRGELGRVKSERVDQDRRIDRMADRLDQLESERDRLQGRVRALSTWAGEVTRIIERPEILAVLRANDLHIQPPPLDD